MDSTNAHEMITEDQDGQYLRRDWAWSVSPADIGSSPVTGPSPVTDLSFNLQSLCCHEAGIPRRRLWLTPELASSSPPGLKRERGSCLTPLQAETPTGPGKTLREAKNRRRGERFLSLACSAPMKRLRVNLSSRFASEPRDPTATCINTVSPQGGDRTLQDNQHALLSLRRVRGHRGLSLGLLQSNMEDQCLTGDFCKPLVLPVERVDHQNLHCISADTVAALLRGQYKDAVEDFLIVDCRYPYEYQGGHIKGAVNLHTKAQIQGALMQVPVLGQLSSSGKTLAGSSGGDQDPGGSVGAVWRENSQAGSMTSSRPGSPATEGSSPRKLVVFHCEFSTERGPRLCGYLRELDRALHSSAYPLLFYPEVYLLDQGYKHFYCRHTDLCEPRGYVPMRHRDYREQLCRSRRRARRRARSRLPARAAPCPVTPRQ